MTTTEDTDKEERKRNSLRCDDVNLKVIVGGEQEDEGDRQEEKEGKERKQVFWHYSHILASQSRFVDALLSAPLAAAAVASTNKEDDASNTITEISFSDISPLQWKRMIHFVTDPVSALDMTIDDAMELIILYDKYDFHTGLKLCDKVLSSIFYKNEQEFKSHVMNNLELLDRCVHVVVLSHEKNLKTTLVNGMAWLHKIFYWNYYAECVILTVDYIRQLVPVIAFYSDDENYENVQDAIKKRLSDESIDILNPMFPDFFVSQIQLIVAQNTTLKLVNEIDISDCAQVVGTYYAFDDDDGDNNIGDTCMYYKDNMDTLDRFLLKKNDVGDWIIQHLPDRDVPEGDILFISKHSRCKSLPPKTGWEKMGGGNYVFRQRNLPMFSYYHNSDTGRKEITI
mmetsp:Transcript_2387/g.2759  ORF Transcript_2387/g.2759 Transcript_2387/m.2759 type:complete len:397 (+) Transcript_2387:149-1339(+)